MTMGLIQVNQTQCVKCGICAAICPRGIISMRQEFPEVVEPEFCIACGQCVAVCPCEALDHIRAPLSRQVPLRAPVIDRETACRFLRSRRSIRCYTSTPVSREKILQLMEIARFAPTGGNSQGISYIVIADSGVLRQISALTINWLEEHLRLGADWAGRYAGYVKNYRSSGTDVILRNAPCLIIATAPRSFARGRENTSFSLAYVELYAPTLGLGSCWAGLLELCAFSGCQPMLELLDLPADKTITGAIMLGYPQYRYHRLVDRNSLQIDFR